MPNKKCPHNKRKNRCINCGGKGICIHNRIRYQCKECRGSQICEHNKFRSQCKECGGSKICKHNIQKSHCKECRGSNICEHEKGKDICRKCRGRRICEHNIVKTTCKECRGSQICKHNKMKYYCKDCNGNGICKHNKLKSYCKECDGSRLCSNTWCELKYNSNIYKETNEKFCCKCFAVKYPDHELTKKIREKTKELKVVHNIKEKFPDYNWVFDKQLSYGADCTTRRRPDIRLFYKGIMLCIEVDENQHKSNSYTPECEENRYNELFMAR